MGANDSKIILGQKPDGTFTAVKVDESGQLVTTGSSGGSSSVQITNGSGVNATITDVAGKKALDVNVTDITLSHANDSTALGDGSGLITSDVNGSKRSINVASVPLILKNDIGATYSYLGVALPGTATSSANWRIIRETNATGDTAFADGDSNFDNIWNNRNSLSYS